MQTPDQEPLQSWREAVLETELEDFFRAPPPAVNHSRRFGALAAAAALVITAGIAFGVFPEDSIEDSESQHRSKVWPLVPGSEWKYRIEDEAGKRTVSWRAGGTRRVEAPRGTLSEIVEQGPSDGRYVYISIHPDGIRRARAFARGEGPGCAKGSGTLLVPLPIGATTQWQTTATYFEKEATKKRKLRGAIESLAEPILIDKKEHRAILIGLRSTAKDDRFVERIWLVQGIGLVRREIRRDGNVISTQRLQSFALAKPQPAADRVLGAFLKQRNWHDARVRWLEPSWLRARPSHRFAVVEHGDEFLCVRVGNGRAREFRWNQARHVQDWLDEEGWTEWHDGALRFGRVSSVASLCQQVWAATNGATIRSEPGKTSSYSGKQAAVMLDAIWERDGKPLPKKTVTVRIDGKGQIRGLYGK